MTPAQYRHFGCRITDDLLYKGMRTIFLENDLLRVGILLDKGADIFQFLYKPADVDFLWRSPQGLVPPSHFTATRASASGAFLDSYHGGWQEILPGGGPVDYRGAELGLHGEVTNLGWEYTILEDRPDCTSVRLSVDCIRTPLRLERVMRLETGRPTLFIDETLTNTSPEELDLMWGHHPAFGAPFLREGVRLFVPAGEAQVHSPRFAESGLLEPGASFPWPLAPTNGSAIDLSCVPGLQAGFAELLYLKNLSGGWYAVLDPQKKVGFGLSWPTEIFPYLWFWMVYGRAPGYPWWNRVYVIALEPWTSIPNSLDQALQTGAARHLKGGEQLNVSLTASAIAGLDRIHHINPNGSIE
jgi:galactose mutarotase-like enzyme